MAKINPRQVGGVGARPSAIRRQGGQQPTGTRRVGGVGARPRPLIQRGEAGPLAPAIPDFVYNGGPVITCPFIYASFWGSLWLSDPAHLEAAGRLTQFLEDLVNSNFMNILSQYGVASGNTGTNAAGLYMQTSFCPNVANQLANSDIENTIQQAINAGAVPEPPAGNTTNVLVIYLDENTEVNDPSFGIVMCEPSGDNAFGYHWFFTTAAGNPFYYAVIPALNDACIENSCPGGSGCSLNLAETQEQRRTLVTSHEFAEMCTDPAFPTGWYSPTYDECGDICNGESASITGTTSPNVWSVQPIYSKYDDINSNGAVYCLAEAASPEPRLSPGPAAGVSPGLVSARRMGLYRHLLPLPPVNFDVRTGVTSIEDRHIRRYVNKLFYPLSHENVFSDFPGLLRTVASVLEKPKR